MARVYTDGACGKDGVGGWAWCITEGHHLRTWDSGGLRSSTNQRAELQAAIEALAYVQWQHWRTQPITLVSDSAYLINCLTQEWYENWYENGWENSAGKPVANKELWVDLLSSLERRWESGVPIEYIHIRGHGKRASDDPQHVHWNAWVDELAGTAVDLTRDA